MRIHWAKLFTGAAKTARSVLGADNCAGTGKWNGQKSHDDSGLSVVNSLTLKIEPIASGDRVTATGQKADGTPIHSSFTVKHDGQDHPVPKAPFDHSSH
jgi:hypothetical protein